MQLDLPDVTFTALLSTRYHAAARDAPTRAMTLHGPFAAERDFRFLRDGLGSVGMA